MKLVVVADRQALGVGQGLLELGGEFVEAHDRRPCGNKPDINMGKATWVFKPRALLKRLISWLVRPANSLLAGRRFCD